jgi:hypothetical protein
MRIRRRSKGFEQAGTIRADQLGLPAKRARELLIARAWQRVAGDVMATSVPVAGVRRGVLEITAPDRRWADTVRPLMPRLAGRMAAELPELKIRACRLLEDGEGGAPAGRIPIETRTETPPSEEAPAAPAARAPAATESTPRPAGQDPGERLRAVMERYLELARARRARR